MFGRKKRRYRILYCTSKSLADGEIYVVYASDKDEYELLLQEIKDNKYTVLDITT